LSEFASLTGYNKATTLRFLTALEAKGFVEQDEETKVYKLGPSFLRFSQLREASFPLADAVAMVLRDLNTATNETALASVIAGEWLSNIGVIESKRMNRVIIEPGGALPFHATASGLAYLAYAAPDIIEAALDRELESHSAGTVTDPKIIVEKLEAVRQQGIAYTSGTFEDDVVGIAAPYFGPSGKVCGSVAIAMPSVRGALSDSEENIVHVKKAAKKLTALRGGVYPENYLE
jgi:DNA-binding IclR family transcriptional regulator